MWCLLHIFSFLVKDKVSDDDPYLRLVLNLNQVNEIIFAPKIQLSSLPYLHKLICHHLQEFKKLFPNENLIDKHHHMMHYPLLIEKRGPSIHLACFKYEARHQAFVRYGKLCCNFKNIIKSISNISQITQCSIWGTGGTEIRKRIQIAFAEDVDYEKDPEIMKIFMQNSIKLVGYLRRVNKLQICGVQY